MSQLKRCLRAALTAVVAMVLLPVGAHALTCDKSAGGCTATISTSIWTGTPTVLCNAPYHVVRVEVTVHCSGCDSTQSFLRCGSSSNSVQFTACGHTHTVSLPYDGNIWEDALSDCGVMVYTAP